MTTGKVILIVILTLVGLSILGWLLNRTTPKTPKITIDLEDGTDPVATGRQGGGLLPRHTKCNCGYTDSMTSYRGRWNGNWCVPVDNCI